MAQQSFHDDFHNHCCTQELDTLSYRIVVATLGRITHAAQPTVTHMLRHPYMHVHIHIHIHHANCYELQSSEFQGSKESDAPPLRADYSLGYDKGFTSGSSGALFPRG